MVSIVLLTDESRSKSSLASVLTDSVASSLDYMYLNTPASRFEHKSRIHHGSTSLEITGRPATRLQGRYWTNRDSRGELNLAARIRRTVDDYEEAEKAFAQRR
ncbi:MAG: hypothetical protein HYX63_00040 [Gammaproteobacteria bacterium]|nr:hypothetical protein [Gammaproteobacteria bacterium]